MYLSKHPGEKPRDISHSNKPVINTDPEAVDMSVKYFQLFIAPASFHLRRKNVLVSVNILVYCDLSFHIFIGTA